MSFFLNILRSLISNSYSSDMDRNVDTWIDSGFDDSKLLSCNLNVMLAAAKDWMIRHEQIATQGRAMSTRLHHGERSLCLQAEEEAIKDSDQKDIWNELFAASRQPAEFSSYHLKRRHMHLEAEYLLQSLLKIPNIAPPRLDTLAANWQAAIVLRNNALIGPPEMASSGLLLIATLLARPGSGVTTHDFQRYIDHYAIDDQNHKIGNNQHNDYKEGCILRFKALDQGKSVMWSMQRDWYMVGDAEATHMLSRSQRADVAVQAEQDRELRTSGGAVNEPLRDYISRGVV